MTDRSGVLRDWRVVLAGGLAVLVAGVVTVVVRSGNPATADTVLTDTRDAAVVFANGTLVTAEDGQRVPAGATVRTGPQGGARLTTDGRDVYLGALTTVRVGDGVHQALDRGQVMVDGRDGPRLSLATKAGNTDIPSGGLVRVETGPVLRLAVFHGLAVLTAAGRQAATKVPSLYQVQAPYAGLPGRPTPLALRDDAWEERLATDLVNADDDLNALARALSGPDGTTVLQTAPVALRRVAPTSTDHGEQALGVALAQASRNSAPVQDTLTFVQTARDEGGSWGVVAALVQARVTAVSALLDTVLAPPGPTPPTVAGPQPALPTLSPSPAPVVTAGPPVLSPSHRATTSPTRSPGKRPTSPTPSPSDLLTTVMNLLSPSPSSVPAASTPRPTGLLHLRIG